MNADQLRRILECPVCLEIPKSTPIFCCKNRHILCTPCRSKIKDCPVCQIPLENDRCSEVEEMIEALRPQNQVPVENNAKENEKIPEEVPEERDDVKRNGPPKGNYAPKKSKLSTGKKIAIATGATVGGAALCLAAAPLALGAAGFTAGGVAAGSFAAALQSAVYGGATGGIFAALQSAGAAGLGFAGSAVVGGTGAAAGGAIALAATNTKKSDEDVKEENESGKKSDEDVKDKNESGKKSDKQEKKRKRGVSIK